jgi:hypothetical protein
VPRAALASFRHGNDRTLVGVVGSPAFDTEREYCRSCRTFSAPGPRCGNCFRSRDGIGDELDETVARSLSEARVVHRTSRLQAGTTTFGPAGRVALSVAPVLAILVTARLAYRFRGGPEIAFFLVAFVATSITMTGFLWTVWRRERID